MTTTSPAAPPALSGVVLSRGPSTPAASQPNPVTPAAVQSSTTPSPTPETTPAPAAATSTTPTPKPSIPLAPARFVLGNLTIIPTTVMEGEEVTYSIQVSNVGGDEGSYTVVFKYKSTGGSIGSDSVEVTLEPGQTKMATISTTKNEAGTYFVNVNDKGGQHTVTPLPTPTPIRGVPATSASAITSPPLSMAGINTHTEVYGTGADPNIITLGPKIGSLPDWPTYPNKHGMEFELPHWTPVLAPIDMVLVGFSNNSAKYRIQSGVRQTPYNDLMLFFESASPDWPGMIIKVYHLYSSPLLPGHNQSPGCSEVEEWGSAVQAQGHLFFEFDDYVISEKGNASCDALIGYKVRRGELIGFAGSVGTHSMAAFCFKVSHTSENPTVQKGNRYLHWVQPSSFFYWKSYSPDTKFPSGVLAYPFESDGHKLPDQQRDVNFKYTAPKQ